MSKLETPLTRWYWKQVGGLLIEEFPIVLKSATNGARYLDGLIILNELSEVRVRELYDIKGRDVVVVQSKARRLNLPLMGQAIFSLQLVRALSPRSAQSVAVCMKDDSVLRPLLESHEGCSVKVAPGDLLARDL